jgi:imidazolonepropionase-like amidohydrolase
VAQTILLTGATVLVGDRLTEQRAALEISGERISRIVPDDETDPAGADKVDVSCLTLLPGFIDSHVHIGFFPPAEVLAGGVTTARDLAWPAAEIFALAAGSTEVGFDGPEILAAGPMLTAPGGYPTTAAWAPPGTGWEVAGEAEAENAVDDLAGAGAHVIKVALNAAAGPTLAPALLKAIVERAHRHGLRTTGHVTGLDELHKALDAGLDELAHMLRGTDLIPAETLARMVAAGMPVVPTLAPLEGDELDVALQNLRAFIAAGGQVIYGTDLGDEGPLPGIDPLEVTRMAAAGMSAHDIAVSATNRAARWLGLRDRGSLTEGKRADVIGIGGPLTVDSLTDVRLVVRAGRVVKTP